MTGSNQSRRILRLLPALGWMALIFVLSAQPDLPHPKGGLLDKLVSSGAHILLFGVLAVLWAWALGQRRSSLLVALAVTVLYGLSDEFHQAFVPGRTPDPWDLVCDGLGALVGLGLWTWWHRRAGRKRPSRATG